MEGFDHIGIAIACDGLLVRLEEGTWEYANYKIEFTSILNRCTKSILEDEIYECLEVDRNAYHIKMKFLSCQASQVVEPVYILDLMQRWYFKRRTTGELLKKRVTKWMEEELKLRNLESLRLRMKATNMSKYVVYC